MAKRKQRKRPEDEFVHYVATVAGWDCTYGISAASGRPLATGSYDEIATLEFSGDIIRPEGFQYPRTFVTLSAHDNMLDNGHGEPAKIIGTLYASDELLDLYVSVPTERMAGMIALAASNRINAVAVVGSRLRYRRGTVHSLQLMTEFNKEDY